MIFSKKDRNLFASGFKKITYLNTILEKLYEYQYPRIPMLILAVLYAQSKEK